MKSSTKDRVKGRVNEVKGELKEKAGRATRDPDMQDRGTAEKVGGTIQRKVGEVKKVFGNKSDASIRSAEIRWPRPVRARAQARDECARCAGRERYQARFPGTIRARR